MKPDVSYMKPAFRTDGHAFAFCLLVASLFILPLVLGAIPKSTAYSAFPASVSDANYLHNQVFVDRTDADVVFVGSSMMWNAINAEEVQLGLRTACGHEKQVVMLTHNILAMDTDYFLLKDLLKHRRVRLVLMQMPPVNTTSPIKRWPCELSEYYFMPDDWSDMCGLSFIERACMYTHTVFGAPRKIISALRPNIWGQLENDTTPHLGSRNEQLGYAGTSFQPFNAPQISPSAEEMLHSSTPESFAFNGQSPNSYQMYFINKTVELLQQHHVKLVLLHLPALNEAEKEQIPERLCWSDILKTHPEMMGIKPSLLFKGLSKEQTQQLFGCDMHLNANGNKLFSRALNEGIVHEYKQAIAAIK